MFAGVGKHLLSLMLADSTHPRPLLPAASIVSICSVFGTRPPAGREPSRQSEDVSGPHRALSEEHRGAWSSLCETPLSHS